MYELFFDRHFLSSAKKLEAKLKHDLDDCLRLLEIEPLHQHLHLKPLHGSLSGLYSFRVRKYRVIIEFLSGKKIRLVEIDKRDKVYK